MTELKVTATVLVDGGSSVERMVCHPRLPLVACWDAERPAVHVWDFSGGQLRELGSVGSTVDAYGDVFAWERMELTPAVAWHPEQPLLVVATRDGLQRWTPDGVAPVGVASSYRCIAFSPDGQALWASPSARENEADNWESSDVLDLASGTVAAGPGWDTGVVEHPGGGLVVTFVSDQGATYCLFASAPHGAAPTAMRRLRHALILDCDGYQTPIFSADGRHFAIRGNAYGNSVEVFEFPSLRRVLSTPLGDPSPGYPYPPEWLAQMESWSRHNLAFASHPGVLWIATPESSLLEVDVSTRAVTEHKGPHESRLTALTVTSTGELLAASDSGRLSLLTVLSEPVPNTRGLAKASAEAFLAATSELPADGDLETDLVLTDGTRTWEADDLSTLTEADQSDPTWLQIQAVVNKAQAQNS